MNLCVLHIFDLNDGRSVFEEKKRNSRTALLNMADLVVGHSWFWEGVSYDGSTDPN